MGDNVKSSVSEEEIDGKKVKVVKIKTANFISSWMAKRAIISTSWGVIGLLLGSFLTMLYTSTFITGLTKPIKVSIVLILLVVWMSQNPMRTLEKQTTSLKNTLVNMVKESGKTDKEKSEES